MIKKLSHNNLQSGDEDRIRELFQQLSSRKTQNIQDLLSDPKNNIHLACIREGKTIIGMASLSTYKVVSGNKGWIEDVVVDRDHRGKGIGKLLIQYLMDLGKELGLTEIFLFTEEEKKAAIHLYEKLGFVQKNSRLYHLKFSEN